MRAIILLAVVVAVAQAQDLEQFTLKDGRVLVGTYDAARERMSVETGSGRVVIAVTAGEIVARKPHAAVAARAPQPEAKAPVPVVTPEVKTPEPTPAPPPREVRPPLTIEQQARVAELRGKIEEQRKSRAIKERQWLALSEQRKEVVEAIGLATDTERIRQLKDRKYAIDREMDTQDTAITASDATIISMEMEIKKIDPPPMTNRERWARGLPER